MGFTMLKFGSIFLIAFAGHIGDKRRSPSPTWQYIFFRTALLEAGFTPDDYYFDPEMDNTEQSILLLQNGQQTQLSFQPKLN